MLERQKANMKTSSSRYVELWDMVKGKKETGQFKITKPGPRHCWDPFIDVDQYGPFGYVGQCS